MLLVEHDELTIVSTTRFLAQIGNEDEARPAVCIRGHATKSAFAYQHNCKTASLEDRRHGDEEASRVRRTEIHHSSFERSLSLLCVEAIERADQQCYY